MCRWMGVAARIALEPFYIFLLIILELNSIFGVYVYAENFIDEYSHIRWLIDPNTGVFVTLNVLQMHLSALLLLDFLQ